MLGRRQDFQEKKGQLLGLDNLKILKLWLLVIIPILYFKNICKEVICSN